MVYSQYYRHNVVKKSLVVLLSVLIAGIALTLYSSPISWPSTGPSIVREPASCFGIGDCFSGKVNKITNGNVIEIDRKILKLALVSSPNFSATGGLEAKQFVEKICPVGSRALVDEDGGQQNGSFGRILAVVYCDDVNLNSALIESGLAKLATNRCSLSEFSEQDWVKTYGC